MERSLKVCFLSFPPLLSFVILRPLTPFHFPDTAKAYAEKGRTHVNSGLAKADQQWSQRQQANANNSNSEAHSPGLSGSAPPLPPSRSTGPPPPPSSRNRAYSGTTPTSSSTSGFSFANLPPSEKSAFFALLDEYFSTRPQFESLFTGTSAQEIENLSSFPRRGPLPPPASASVPAPVPVAAPPPPVPTPAARTLGICTALYDYEPSDSGDLAFSEGDRITLIEIGEFHDFYQLLTLPVKLIREFVESQ